MDFLTSCFRNQNRNYWRVKAERCAVSVQGTDKGCCRNTTAYRKETTGCSTSQYSEYKASRFLNLCGSNDCSETSNDTGYVPERTGTALTEADALGCACILSQYQQPTRHTQRQQQLQRLLDQHQQHLQQQASQHQWRQSPPSSQSANSPHEYLMTGATFRRTFPFHIVFDFDGRVIQSGSVVHRLMGDSVAAGTPIHESFSVICPLPKLSRCGAAVPPLHAADVQYTTAVQQAVTSGSLGSPCCSSPLDTRQEVDRQLLRGVAFRAVVQWVCSSSGSAGISCRLQSLRTGLILQGRLARMSMPDGRAVLLFLGSPHVANLEEMELHGLYLSDIPLHDMSRDFVLLAEQRQAEADLKERFETMAVELRLANERLEQATRWLDEERQRSDALLYRMLPADIAADLREGRKVEAINYPEVTILFSDMVGFTTTSAKSTAEEVYNMLNEMYDKFDSLVDEFPDIYKLETIGDAYFLVCNLTTDCDDHVDVVIDFAIRMQALARHVKNAQGEPVQIRIGIHTGPVVGGVLGAKTPRFSVYGDTVNVASRMESHGLPGKIHISAASYSRIVAKAKYAVRERGNIAVKGRGNMTTYLIGGINDDWLLRHNSFDAQIDGGGPATRDGSFVITASGRSLESMGNNRLSSAMESITEGDEDRGSKTYNLATSSQSTDVGPATSAAPPSAASTSTGSTQQFAPVSFGSQTASVAAGRASEPGVITAGNSDGANTGVSQVRSTTVMDGLINANLAAAFSIAGGGGAPLTSVGSGGSFVAGGCGSFRDTGPLARENSHSLSLRETVSRDTSFRAVYARGGRQPGNASSMISNGSRIALVNGGLGPVSSLVHLAARSDFASDSDAGSASGLGNAGGSGGIALECPMNSLSRRAGTDSSQHGNEANVGSAGSCPGSMGAVGVPGGFVMARSATYKAPLPGQSPASVTGGAAAAPSAGTASRTSAEAVGSPRGSLRQQLNQPDSPFGAAAAMVGAAGAPTQAAVLQQLRETPSEDLGPRASSGASSRTQSEMGADGQALPSGKSKGLTNKLKNWLKK